MDARPFFPPRTQNFTEVFTELDAPDNFLTGVLATRVVAGAYLPFYAVAMVLVIRSIALRRATTPQQRKTLWLVLINLFFSATNTVFMIVMVSTTLDWNVCTYVGGIGGLFYISANAATYFILLQRANVVYALDAHPPKMLILTAKAGCYSVPGLAIFSMFTFSGRHYFSERYCVQDVAPILSWIFLVMDTSLSVVFLALFVLPLLRHVSKMRQSGEMSRSSNRLLRLAKQNMFLSSTAIGSTFIFMVMVSSVAQALAASETPEDSAWRLQQYYGSATDLLINALVSLAITRRVWSPARDADESSIGTEEKETSMGSSMYQSKFVGASQI